MICPKCGTNIYVEYIYNYAWAVFKLNDTYAFVAMYDYADPGSHQLVFKNQ